VREADLLLHVVDISHPEFEDHINSVNDILRDIESQDKQVLMVFNKIDAYRPQPLSKDEIEKTEKNFSIEDWKNTWMSRLGEENAIFISAIEKSNFEEFRKRVYDLARKIHVTRFPYNNFLFPDYEDIE
jgi:GTP-binding protein HflX